ncbi:MAG: BMP family ABC transporter substrate-binding protein [Clostridiales bacterium]|nr:BMP family ABC transporter substrate-binding protein [Clostridiales bacterium]
MKKFLALALVLVLCAAVFAGCKKPVDPDNPSDGSVEIAFVTDVGQLMDKSFNQGTWEGCQQYAQANNKTVKYFQPANGADATDADRVAAMEAAVTAGAKIVVAAGFMQAGALATVAAKNPDVKFVFIDGWALTDENKNVLENVAGIAYQEEQAGYLAGYAVVMDGYTKLGFCGGGGGTNPACCRYGYGYVQGAEAAAAVKGVDVEINYSWQYGENFSASPELQTMAAGWYNEGTEIIFACGGSMFASITAAASANDAKVVGVDVDQSSQSTTVVTSAMKGLSASVVWAISKFYDGNWADIGGKNTSLGANDNAVGLPTETWSLTGWTVDEYKALFEKIKSGEVVVSPDYPTDMATYEGAHVKVTVK